MVEGRMTVVYLPPPGGIARSDLERSFIIPDGFDWSLYEEFDSPHESASTRTPIHHRLPEAPLSAVTRPSSAPKADASNPVPDQPGDSIEAPTSGGASVPGDPGDSIEAPTSGGAPFPASPATLLRCRQMPVPLQ